MSNQKNNNLSFKFKLAIFAGAAILSSAQAMADVLNPIIGSLLYEENFNTLDSNVWSSVDGDGCEIGLCGWGNQELEYYSPTNLSIVNVPFEPATKALAIEARREAHGTHSFTSGKITSANKLQVKYGLIEFRMSTPQVGVGLWPAGWMLGTSLAAWPSKGELDIMEMGHSAAAMAGAGLAGSDINSYTGSNAIFYATGACSTANPTCAASTSWQTTNAYVAHTPLTNRFVTYRMYWTDSQIRFTVIDAGVEHDMYASPIPITPEASEFQAPFYFLFNLAVGGQFTDAPTPAQVTAPLPGKMYIDYIRVYQLNGLGEVKLGSQVKPETGTFGVFTDNTPTTNKQEAGVSDDIWIWNATSTAAGTTPAYEGSNVIAWKYTASQWFGGGIASRQAHDMSNFINGNLKFRIKIPANVGFKIGVSDTFTNENYVNFPANTTAYGLVRNGAWAQATVPVSALRGNLVALQSMSALFNIASIDPQPTANFEMAIDDIVWECGTGAACQATSSTSSSVATSASRSSVSSVTPSSKSSSSASSFGDWICNGVPQNTPCSSSSSKSSIKSSVFSSVKSSTASSITSGVASLYQHCNFGGYVAALNEGSYTLAQLNALGVLDNDVSSLKVQAGYQLKVFTDNNFAGTSIVKTADDSCLVDDGFNDVITSVVVSKISTGWSTQIEAESFVAMNGIQTQDSSEGGLNVGWIDTGDWIVWDINLPSAGTYKVEYRVASAVNGGVIQLEKAGGSPIYGTINVSNTNGWQNWQTISHTVTLAAGQQQIAIYALVGGYNINWIKFTKL